MASAPGGRPGSPAHLRSRSRSSAAHPRPLARIYLHPQLLRRPGNNDTTLQCDNDLKSGTGCSMSPPTAVPSNLHAVFATNGTERASAHAAAEEIHSACSTSLRGASALKSGTGLTDLTAGQQIRGQWRVGTGGQVSRLLGWGVAAEGVQDGRKCRIPMAACLHGRKCQHSTAICVCCCPCSTILILVQASLGWCTPMLGCLHRLVCLYKAQINSNQVCATNSCIYDLQSSRITTRHSSKDNTSTPKTRTNRPHDVAHASVPVIPSRERVDAAPVCSSSRTRDGTASPASPPPFGGEEAGGAREGWRGGLRGLPPPWEKKVGFEALARGFACCLHITS